MKALALYGAGDLRLEERPIPHPGPNQLVVKIDYVGICGTDLEFYAGHYPRSSSCPWCWAMRTPAPLWKSARA